MTLSSDNPIWVGIDLGTQSVRVIAVSDEGEIVASASRPLQSRRDGGRHEQDAESWWLRTRECLEEVTSALAEPSRIRALAISATSGTVCLVDDDGRPLGPGIMYDDTRGALQAARANDVGRTLWTRLGYAVQGSWALPKVVELARSGALGPGIHVAFQPDVVAARLAGRRTFSDSSHALKAGLDLDGHEWPEAILEELGVPQGTFGGVLPAGAVLAEVGDAGSASTGIPVGCAIVAGMTDGCAAQLASGATSPGQWNSVLGTTLVVKGVSDTRRVDPTGAVYSHRAPFGGGWLPGGASNTGARALLHWLPDADLDLLTNSAKLIEDPGIAYPLVGRSERFPFVADEAEGFFGDSPHPDTAPPRALAQIAHGTAHLERLCYDALALRGYDMGGTISFTGGGARNRWWNQLRCDVLGREVRIPEASEGALGMAMLAAAALGPSPSADSLHSTVERMGGRATLLSPRPNASHLSHYSRLVGELHRRGWIDDELADFAGERAR